MNLKTCRVCLNYDGISYIFDKNNELCNKILHCCPNVKIRAGDGLPALICKICEDELTTSYHFIIKCEKSDRMLQSVISAIKPNINLRFVNIETDAKVKNEVNIDIEGEKIEEYCNQQSNECFVQENQNTASIESVENEFGKYNKNKIMVKNPLGCRFCGQICASKSALIVHCRSHSNEKPFQCIPCNKNYKDSSSLKRHNLRNHSKDQRERNFICETCGKAFYSKNDVNIHMRSHTGETPYPCPLCPAKFTQISTMLRHKKRHTGEKSYVCADCSKGFCTKEEMKSHMLVHTSEKKFSCPLCNVLFKYRNNLRKHIKLHSETNHFVCNFCGKTFKVKGNLKSHLSSQHSEKSGHCSVCLKNVSNIEVHMWKHTGERPLKCELCPGSFYELKALARHMNFKHKQTDKYKCSIEDCTASFPSRPMLDFHVAKLHTNCIPYPCKKCTRGFYRKNDLARHMIGTHKEKLV